SARRPRCACSSARVRHHCSSGGCASGTAARRGSSTSSTTRACWGRRMARSHAKCWSGSTRWTRCSGSEGTAHAGSAARRAQERRLRGPCTTAVTGAFCVARAHETDRIHRGRGARGGCAGRRHGAAALGRGRLARGGGVRARGREGQGGGEGGGGGDPGGV